MASGAVHRRTDGSYVMRVFSREKTMKKGWESKKKKKEKPFSFYQHSALCRAFMRNVFCLIMPLYALHFGVGCCGYEAHQDKMEKEPNGSR